MAKTRQQIANEYGIDRKTFNNWLKRSRLNVPAGLLRTAPATVPFVGSKSELNEKIKKDAYDALSEGEKILMRINK